MAAMSVYPMCIRASRGFLRLRRGVSSLDHNVVELIRGLSTDPSKSDRDAVGGLAQAILQERLQQQHRQVSWPASISVRTDCSA